ncbi:hypothetical protein PENTCL1PPCAC_18004 [Pristionchus entomophagus]|uniref:Uncharacterized protein n=1 Tax=Pristionchus entomophagus TaxID=358040 RepID=A0AAV5TP44_9BILA|nr:hypothetical protein PENTCL1PPCAC_18004 [Pristionchus entomophagus]
MYRTARRLVDTAVTSIPAVPSYGKGRATLFPEDSLVETPSFELARSISSSASQSLYSVFLEKSFTTQSMLFGANDGLALSCSYMVHRNWDRLSAIASTQMTYSLQSIRDDLDESMLSSLLFSTDDVVHSFIYRSFFTGNRVFNVAKTGNLFIYYLIVSYIRRNDNVPLGLTPSEYLRRHRSNLSVANIGFCRAVNPLSPWKITHLNISL